MLSASLNHLTLSAGSLLIWKLDGVFVKIYNYISFGLWEIQKERVSGACQHTFTFI
jgi:hypothetical protein